MKYCPRHLRTIINQTTLCWNTAKSSSLFTVPSISMLKSVHHASCQCLDVFFRVWVFVGGEGFWDKLNVNIWALLSRNEKDMIFVDVTKGIFLSKNSLWGNLVKCGVLLVQLWYKVPKQSKISSFCIIFVWGISICAAYALQRIITVFKSLVRCTNAWVHVSEKFVIEQIYYFMSQHTEKQCRNYD